MSATSETPFDDRQLAALSALGAERVCPRGVILVQEGDLGEQLYLVRSGRLKVYLDDADGREFIVDVLGPGRLFGEMALEDEPRAASVMTLEPARIVVIPRQRFREFLAADPDAAWSFIAMLIRRSRDLTRNVGSLALLDVYGRVARLLLDHAVEASGGLTLPVPVTRVEIAKRVGASREVVSRILTDLREGGYIEVHEERIVIRRTLPKHW